MQIRHFEPLLAELKLYLKPGLFTLVSGGDDCCFTIDARRPAIKTIEALESALSATCFLSNNLLPGIVLKYNHLDSSQFTSVAWRHVLKMNTDSLKHIELDYSDSFFLGKGELTRILVEEIGLGSFKNLESLSLQNVSAHYLES